jgi:hypothetical protein
MHFNRRNPLDFLPFLFLLILFFGFKSNIYGQSLIQQISAQRDNNGGIFIIGQAKLPKGTKLMIDIGLGNRLVGQSTVFLNDGGNFKSESFTAGGKPHPAGTYKVTIVSYFTKIWQNSEVIAKVGENGILLPQALLSPDDPEFPNAARHLEASFNVVFSKISIPDITSEQQAIKVVQDSILEIPGSGRSADPIKNVVAYFEKAGGFKALKWSAKIGTNGTWIISLDCMDAGKQKQAQWEYNPKTKSVKYLDPLAKLLSWLPAE